MALFKTNYNKPGPGVPKNAPKKKGFGRFFEIVGRDAGSLVKLNVVMQLCYLPAQIFFFMAVIGLVTGSGGFMLFGLLALLASILVGPARTAESYVISKMLRDEPGFFWQDFKKAFKENFKLTAVPGIICSLIFGSQIMAVLFYLAAGTSFSVVWIAVYFASVLLFIMAAPYFFLQAPYLDLRAFPMLKNSLLLAMGNAPRSIAGALLCTVLVGVQWVFFPYAFLITILVGYTFPTLINLMWIWPIVDKTFHIDETLKVRTAKEINESLGEEYAVEVKDEPPVPGADAGEEETEKEPEAKPQEEPKEGEDAPQ